MQTNYISKHSKVVGWPYWSRAHR